MLIRWWRYLAAALLGFGMFAAILAVLAAILIYPALPSLEVLTDYKPKIPLRVYTADGALIGEFGEERRALVKVAEVPLLMKQAILAAEDERFYQHGGVDYLGVARAAIANLMSGGAREGASTITMQVARNFFLSREKTLKRKFSEVLLALKIEHSLTKAQILELYLNQIYLGQRAYGFASAAQTYFGKRLDDLDIAEMAMLAGLPKAPSRYNPVVNYKRAKSRQLYVLRRMHELKFITDAQYQQAEKQHLAVHRQSQFFEVNADYVAEMVRQVMFDRYQDAAYTNGFTVYTTLRREDQQAADHALWQGVMDYDARHGYRGTEGEIDIPRAGESLEDALDDALQDVAEVNGLMPAVVLEASQRRVRVYHQGGEFVEISGDGLKFAQRFLAGSPDPKRRIRRGALIRIAKSEKDGRWQIVQLPEVEAAIVSLNPADGAIRALVGGFDFGRSKFNHAIQAWRQPGSSFKPFIYSAALEKGFTAATIINDAPLSFVGAGGQPWEPKNFDGEYAGPIRLRTALTKSKNLVSIRILQAIGVGYAQDYITRFGFDPRQQPPYLTLALGAGSVTPLQLAGAYAIFANGGYRVKPYYIERIVDAHGNLLAQANPGRAGATESERVIDARNAFIMTSLMQDVVRHGTAARAMQLGRLDLAGKTGTTNDQVDAWFAGFQPSVVAVAWIGFDQPRSLGGAETGAQAALPIWMNYLDKILKGVPDADFPVPEGVAVVKINAQTGLRVPDSQDGLSEYFYQENIPGAQPSGGLTGDEGTGAKASEEVKDQLF